MKTAFLTHSTFRDHINGPHHPERPARLDAIDAALRREELWDKLWQPEFEAAEAELLLLCHTPQLIEQVKRLAQMGGGSIDPDTAVSPASYDGARLAVGAGKRAVDAVMRGECDNAFVAARPPGHHAESNRAMGFCLFNPSCYLPCRAAKATPGTARSLPAEAPDRASQPAQAGFAPLLPWL